jgi:transcriptional regulator with XRE-family HTH domain
MTGKQLKRHRIKLGLNQTQMGELLGLGRSMINKYENNRSTITKSKHDLFKQILAPEINKANNPDYKKSVIIKLDALNEKTNTLNEKTNLILKYLKK